ncbi:hypothetical protein [Mesorhizobium sp.]|uniref:hypothetical protein n=1 Tax=Mesorhizobium sp. TaxID=1871066 RepID=UPI000FE879B5|nr:hypothetical protein [Mesorhizobium sp.]RWO29154.1 MAG: hypothetical protein EOS09_02820 [Mesorhizobium sp.]
MAKRSAGILPYRRSTNELQVLLVPLGELRQPGGKLVTAFGAEGDFDAGTLRSNMFEMRWPPRSGRMQTFPEIDRAGWFGLEMAREKLLVGQRPFLDRLVVSV